MAAILTSFVVIDDILKCEIIKMIVEQVGMQLRFRATNINH
jgi:hypothetical protein